MDVVHVSWMYFIAAFLYGHGAYVFLGSGGALHGVSQYCADICRCLWRIPGSTPRTAAVVLRLILQCERRSTLVCQTLNLENVKSGLVSA